MPNWIADYLGVALNAIALLLLGIWTGLLSRNETSPPQQHRKTKKKSVIRQSPKPSFVILFIVMSFLAAATAFQGLSAYQKHTYNTDAAKYFDDKFSDKMIHTRVSAGIALKEYRKKRDWALVTNSTAGLDDVLGFFDSIGYDQQHGKMSASVAHEYFYDALDGYYRCSEIYIAKLQKTDSKTVFEYVKPLFDAMTQVESEKTGHSMSSLAWTEKDKDDWIDSEAKLKKP